MVKHNSLKSNPNSPVKKMAESELQFEQHKDIRLEGLEFENKANAKLSKEWGECDENSSSNKGQSVGANPNVQLKKITKKAIKIHYTNGDTYEG